MGLLEKIGLTRLVISEEEIYTMVRGVINRPILEGADPPTRAGVSIAITSIMESLKDKEILTQNTVDEVNEILSQWLNA